MTPPDAALVDSHNPAGQAAAAVAADGNAWAVPRQGPFAGFPKYFKIFKITMVERLTYRLDFLVSTFLRFLPLVTTILLWKAIFAGSGEVRRDGFTFQQTVAYLLLVNISRMFSSMPGLAGGIARDVREGTLKKYLIQPLEMIPYLLAHRVAHKLAYIVSSVVPYAVLFLICRHYFDGQLPRDAGTWLAYFVSLILAFLVGFFFETAVGMVGFWFLEVTSLLYVVMTLNFFVSGHMLPLDFLGPTAASILKLLPFAYMAYFPAVVLLGKVHGPELWTGLLVEAGWVIAFAVLARWLYRRGLRRYGAYGG